MSIQKVLINLYPVFDFYQREIDPRLGIILLPDADELIVTEVMCILGVEYKPSMNRLKAILYENLVTDIATSLYSQFTDVVYEVLRHYDFKGINEILIRPKPGFLLEVTYHIPMSVEEIGEYMKRHSICNTPLISSL